MAISSPFSSGSLSQDDLDFLNDQTSFGRTALNTVLTPINTLLNILDTPGGFVRDVLAGDDPFEGIFNPEKRATGRDVLDNLFGQTPKAERWTIGGFDAPSFLTALVTDPMLYIGSFINLTKAGQKSMQLTENLNRGNYFDEAAKILEVKGANQLSAKKAREFADDAFTKAESLREQQVNELLGSYTQGDIFQHNLSGQLAKGQRGLSFNIPFTSREFVPTNINKLLAPAFEFGASVLSKLPKSETLSRLFVATPKTETVRMMKELNDAVARTASLTDTELFNLGLTKAELGKRLEDETLARIERVQGPTQVISKPNKFSEKNLLDESVVEATEEGIERVITQKQLQTEIADLSSDVMLGAERKATILKTNTWEKESIDSINSSYKDKYYELVGKETGEIEKARLEGITDFSNIKQFYKEKQLKLIDDREKNLKFVMNRANEKRDQILKEMGQLTNKGGIPKDLVGSFNQAGIDALEFRQSVGEAITGMNDPFVSYMARRMTPDGKKFLLDLKKSDPDKYRKVLGEVRVDFLKNTDSANVRTLQGKTTREANQFFKDKFDTKIDVFSDDVLESMQQLTREANVGATRAATLGAAVNLLGTSQGGKGFVPASELLAKSNLGRIKFKDQTIEWGFGSTAKQIQNLMDEVGMELYLPKEFVDDLTKIDLFNVGDLESIVPIFDNINKFYRAYLTAHPAHLGTNTIGAMFMNLISGTLNPQTYLDAGRYLGNFYKTSKPDEWFSRAFPRALTKVTSKDEKYFREFLESGAADKGFIFDATRTIKHGTVEGASYPWLSTEALTNNKAMRTIRETNRYVDEVSRMVHYTEKRKAGLSIIDAERSVKKYHFDYSELTSFEKKFMNRAVLFYTFGRKNLPFAIKEIVSNRGARGLAMASTDSLRNQQDGIVPEFISEAGNLGLEDGSFIDIKNPLFEANKFSPQGGGLTRAFDKIGQQLAPQWKVPLELFSDREFFRGKPLDTLTSVPSTTPFAQQIETDRGTEYRIDPLLATIIRENPTSRFSQTFYDFFDPRIPLVPALLGTRVRKFDPETLLAKRARDQIERLVKELPEIRTFNKPFSIEKEPSDKVQRILDLLNASQDILRQ